MASSPDSTSGTREETTDEGFQRFNSLSENAENIRDITDSVRSAINAVLQEDKINLFSRSGVPRAIGSSATMDYSYINSHTNLAETKEAINYLVANTQESTALKIKKVVTGSLPKKMLPVETEKKDDERKNIPDPDGSTVNKSNDEKKKKTSWAFAALKNTASFLWGALDYVDITGDKYVLNYTHKKITK